MKTSVIIQILLFLFCREIHAQKISVTDPPKGMTLAYTVALLSGTIDDLEVTEVYLRNPRIHKKGGQFVVGQAYKGRFKFFAAPEPSEAVQRKFPKTLTISYKNIREKLRRNKVTIRIYDAYGHTYARGDQTIDLGM